MNRRRADALSGTGTKAYIYLSVLTVKYRTSFTLVRLFIFALHHVERTLPLPITEPTCFVVIFAIY